MVKIKGNKLVAECDGGDYYNTNFINWLCIRVVPSKIGTSCLSCWENAVSYPIDGTFYILLANSVLNAFGRAKLHRR